MTREAQILNTSFIKNFGLSPLLTTRTSFIFVWGMWLLMLVIALAHLFIYARNLPLEEDWQMVAAVTGEQHNMVKWLWQLNNEHRIPLPKLILLFLLKTTKDFRSGMMLNILSAALLAAFFIRVMFNLRGNKTHFSDAFFPVALLHN